MFKLSLSLMAAGFIALSAIQAGVANDRHPCPEQTLERHPCPDDK